MSKNVFLCLEIQIYPCIIYFIINFEQCVQLGENMLDELKALIKSPKLWVTMIGVSLIPALYNLSFLGSMWDPYGNVDNLPVAVVNQDKKAKLNDKTLSIGHDMVDSMSKNKALDYHFVSSQKAKQGLKDGDYYMIITLPKDLSKKATTLLTDNPEKLDIKYQTTAGRSVVASKMSDSAMTKLKETVAKNITQTYTKAVFKSMRTLQSGMKKASSGGQELVNGAQRLENGSQTITSNLGTLSSSSQTLADGVGTLNNGLITYTDGVGQLSTGLGTLSNGLNTYTGGVKTLSEGSQKLASQSNQLVNGVAQLKESTGQVQKLADGANQLSTGLEKLASATNLSDEQKNQVSQLTTGLPQLNDAINQLNTTVSNLSLSSTNIDTSGIANYLSDMANQAQAILTASQTDRTNQLEAVKATSAYQSLSADQQSQISAALTGAPSSVISSAQAILQDIQGMRASLTSLQSSLQSSAIQEKLSQLQLGVSQLAGQANVALPGAVEALNTLSGGIDQVNSQLNKKVVPASQQVASGVSLLNSQLATGSTSLLTGVTAYTNAVFEINNGAAKLAANNDQLTNGASSAKSGADKLVANSGQLTSGTAKLADGANQIASGSSKLADGSNTLTSGLTSLSTGAAQLTSSLSKAGNQLSLVSVKNQNAKLVSSPVAAKHKDTDSVKTNGIGMAPYMIAVSLMVVALSTNVIFASSLSGRPAKDRFEWARRKLLINGVISTAGSIVLYGAIQLLGFEANHGWETLFFIILSGWTLMALVTALVGWDDRYGSFLSLLMLLIQVGSAGGSYPIELSPRFFQVVHPYLPMSYIVSGLRQTISMTGSIGKEVGLLIGFLVAFMVLAILIYRPKKD